MHNLPTWDLSPIYPAVDSKEFLEDLRTMTTRSKALEATITRSGAELYSCIR